MVFDGELDLYVSGGRVQPHTTVMMLTAPFRKRGQSTEELEELIRSEYEPEVAAKLIGKSGQERVDDELSDWEAEAGHDTIDPGWMVFASEIDWDAGTLKIDWVPDNKDIREWLFPTGEFLDLSQFEYADLEAEFRGMAFKAAAIEMMLPNDRLDSHHVGESNANANAMRMGRPQKWDWEGALSYIISQAQTPDGLPTGHGSQARLEEMIAHWFILQVGDAPAQSQIRNRASKIVRSLQKG